MRHPAVGLAGRPRDWLGVPVGCYEYDLDAVRALSRAGLRSIAVIALIDAALLAAIVFRGGPYVWVVGGLALLIGAVYLVVMIRLRRAMLAQIDPHTDRPGIAVRPDGIVLHGVGVVPWPSMVGMFVTDVSDRERAKTAAARGPRAFGRRLSHAGTNGWVGLHLFYRQDPPRRGALPRWTPGGQARKERPVEHWGTTVLHLDRIMAEPVRQAMIGHLRSIAAEHRIAWAELSEYGPIADWSQSEGLEALNPARMAAWIDDSYLPPEPRVPYPPGVVVTTWAEAVATRRAQAGRPPL